MTAPDLAFLVTRFVILLLAAALGCDRAAKFPVTRGVADAGAPAAGAAAVALAEDEVIARVAEPLPKDVEYVRLADRALCADKGCCVENLRVAGADGKGRTLVVATVALDGAECLIVRRPPPAAFGRGKLDLARSPLRTGADEAHDEAHDEPAKAGRDTGAEPSGGAAPDVPEADSSNCRALEHHVVIIENKEKVRGRQLLTRECNNGYGAAGVGDDTTTVGEGTRTFEHHREGGSNWRWTHDAAIGLDPVRLLAESRSSYWNVNIDATSRSVSIDWEELTRREDWSAPDCEKRVQKGAKQTSPNKDGHDGENSESSDDSDDGPVRSMAAFSIPTVTLPSSFTSGGWKSTGLGHCGVFVDGTEKNGFTLYGQEGEASDATLRAVASADGTLFVEVSDDRWTGPSRSWIKDDHLELWVATSDAESPSTCDDADAGDQGPTAVQWGIRIADGASFPAFGSPKPLTGIEVVRLGSVARVKIPPPATTTDAAERAMRVALVYSDSDDGKSQERLIATAKLERGRGDTLAAPWIVDPTDARCRVERRALVVTRGFVRHEPDKPIITLEGDPE